MRRAWPAYRTLWVFLLLGWTVSAADRALTGPVEASTGSGRIEAADLGGKKVHAETGSGDIELEYVAVPDDVTLETGSGDATVRLPDESYAVTTESGSGDSTTEVTNDGSSPRKVSVTTGSGDASVLKS